MKQALESRICSVGRTVEILGDRWIFLILREAFFGVRYYDQFQSNLGIATNILSNRLKRLIKNEIMEKRRDPVDARRVRYKLTEKGLDLYPITLAIMMWGDRWLADDEGPPLILHHKKCDAQLTPEMCCSSCGEVVKARDVSFQERFKVEK
ncbi:winged helix-turn-helix transcriptional regulator [candidate division CSSED10-310 bacterium]|uniref:Winged helix-turn-helix transcriptional regulator n=1 Tax=candidate division CSSED10-310 bacterium TaxID=2855610 RepID=A0ABV6YT96_UNCC1